MSCGHNYTFVWTSDGQLYSWGDGHYGVLGHGSDDYVSKPRKVEYISDKAVVTVGAGHDHCGIVTSEGLLFMTGMLVCSFINMFLSCSFSLIFLDACDLQVWVKNDQDVHIV